MDEEFCVVEERFHHHHLKIVVHAYPYIEEAKAKEKEIDAENNNESYCLLLQGSEIVKHYEQLRKEKDYVSLARVKAMLKVLIKWEMLQKQIAVVSLQGNTRKIKLCRNEREAENEAKEGDTIDEYWIISGDMYNVTEEI